MKAKALADWVQCSYRWGGEEAPTSEWCERIARKHAKKAKGKKPKKKDFKKELMAEVKKDKDKDGNQNE